MRHDASSHRSAFSFHGWSSYAYAWRFR